MTTPIDLLKVHLDWKRDSNVKMLEYLELDKNLEAIGMTQEIDNLKPISTSDHVLTGTAHVFFLALHVTCIRTEIDESDSAGERDGVPYHKSLDPDWQNTLDMLYDLSESGGMFATTELPGIPGQWVIFFTPYKR